MIDNERMRESEGIAETLEVDESAALIWAWRLDQFSELGFDDVRAEMLSTDGAIDLAQARRLVTLGCPLETALRILV